MNFLISQTGSILFIASSLCLLLSASIVIAASTDVRTNSGSKLAPLLMSNKVFNYQDYMPIKEERLTGETPQTNVQNETTTTTSTNPSDQEEAEAACWKLINEQSVVTFALQRKVLDELDRDIKDLKLDDNVREFINKTSTRMRQNMDEAEKALKKDAADEFFDALFDTSEDIISMSSIMREPHLSDEVFLVFVKAISRLGRNNATLIQDFAEMCSFVQKSPRPKRKNLLSPKH